MDFAQFDIGSKFIGNIIGLNQISVNRLVTVNHFSYFSVYYNFKELSKRTGSISRKYNFDDV
jgi:hypothetical protein